MKRYLLPLILLATNTLACSSCKKPTITPDPVVPETSFVQEAGPDVVVDTAPEPPKEYVLSHKNFDITIPAGWTQEPSDNVTIPVVAVNGRNKIVVNMNAYPDYAGYVLSAVRGIKEAGATVNSTSPVDINGHRYTVVNASIKDMTAITWLTVANGVGYGVHCAVPTKEFEIVKPLCEKVILSFKIKG